MSSALDALDYYGKEITRVVLEQSKDYQPLEKRNTYGKAFLQIMNIWRQNEIVKEFVFGKRLARIASDLLKTQGVRIYPRPGSLQGSQWRLHAVACRSILLAAGDRENRHGLDSASRRAAG